MARYSRSDYADYEDVVVKKTNYNNLPATLDSVSLFRHNLLKGKNNDSITALAEELSVDKELGLINQANLTASKSLKNDINELTSSNDYFEVSTDLLKKLFQIPHLRAKCFFYNVVSALKGFFVSGALPLSLNGLMLFMIVLLGLYSSWVV